MLAIDGVTNPAATSEAIAARACAPPSSPIVPQVAQNSTLYIFFGLDKQRRVACFGQRLQHGVRYFRLGIAGGQSVPFIEFSIQADLVPKVVDSLGDGYVHAVLRDEKGKASLTILVSTRPGGKRAGDLK